jgi:hypothetical protein
MEREKEEAYRIYVSDSLALYSTWMTKGEVDVPRYADMFSNTKQEEKPQETPEEIISRFDKLRRKEE